MKHGVFVKILYERGKTIPLGEPENRDTYKQVGFSGQTSELAEEIIDLPPMAHPNDAHDERRSPRRIDDPIIADPYPVVVVHPPNFSELDDVAKRGNTEDFERLVYPSTNPFGQPFVFSISRF